MTPTSRSPSTTGAALTRASDRTSKIFGRSVPAGMVSGSGAITSDELGEPVDALAGAVGDDADRDAVLDHDHDAVRALGQQRQRLGRPWRSGDSVIGVS